MRTSAWMFAGALALASVGPAAAADGNAGVQATWARWQGRLSLVTTSAPWHLGVENMGPRLQSATLMSDYYFNRSFNSIGGLRATGGLIFGPRSTLNGVQPGVAGASTFSIATRSAPRATPGAAGDRPSDVTTAPYLGVGYTGLPERGGWSFSADLGLVAQGADPARSGRALATGPSLDDMVRDLRMRPLLQLGASYSF